ncbi:RHS repeat-associated protein [Catenulispora sp. EB89]
MVRPTGWDVLGLDGDPTPGVVESVQALAKEFGDFAHDVEAAYRSLNSFGSDTAALQWVGQTADAFKGKYGPLPGRLQKLYTSYGEASDALSAYWPQLQAAQTKADTALRQAQDAHADLQRATTNANSATSDLKTAQQNQAANPNQQAVTDAQTAHDTAQTNLDNAKAKMAALTKQANDAYNDRISAAKTCASALHHAQSDGIHNKSWWDHVGEDLSKWGGEIGKIAGELAPILDIIALATSWIPGVDVVTAALAEADNIIALAGTAIGAIGDAMQGHWGDALLGAGMLALTFVGGRALGSGAEDLEGEAGALEGEAGALDGEADSLGSSARDVDGNEPAVCENDPIDVVSGQMLITETDLALPGVLSLVLRRAYASGYQNGRLFGPGWSSTLDQRIAINAAGIHFAGDDAQTLHYPLPDTAEAPVLPDRGARWPLVWDRDLDEIRITDSSLGHTYHYPLAHHRDEQGEIRDLTAISDRNGNRVVIARDQSGTPQAVTYADYRVAVDTVVTGVGSRITGLRLLGDDHGTGASRDSIVGGSPGSTVVRAFDYDVQGRLTGVVDSSGLPFRYEYSGEDRITAWTDRVGNRYAYEYDALGRVVRTVGDGGYLSGSFSFDSAARTTVFTDSFGATTTYHYDEFGHVTTVIDALGHISSTEYDRHGQLLSTTDQLGAVTRLERDEQGRPVRVLLPEDGVIDVEYGSLGLATRVVGADRAVWQYSYDARGNLIGVLDPTGAASRHEYDDAGRLIASVDAAGAVLRMTVDAAGLPTVLTGADGHDTRITRDAFGRAVEIAEPLGVRTTMVWDVEGRMLERRWADGSTEQWSYDAEGNLRQHRDEAGGVTSSEYGVFGLLTARTTPDGARHVFSYDTELRLVGVTNPAGAVWSYRFDAAGRLVGERDFNSRALNYVLDPAGRLAERRVAGGPAVAFERDPLGRAMVRRSGDAVTTFAYDAVGRILSAEGPGSRLDYTRDAVGRILTETVNGQTLVNEYDARGLRVGRVSPSGVVSRWGFDASGHVTSLRGSAAALSFVYDEAGREISRGLGADAVLCQSYDVTGRVVGQQIWAGMTSTGGIRPESRRVQERAYRYRADGAVTAITDLLRGDRAFELDPLGRVTAVDGASWHEAYQYDAYGNLLQSEVPGDSSTNGGRAGTGTLIKRAGRTTYEYDDQDRIVRCSRRTLSGQVKRWSYTWDPQDRLVEVATPDGGRWTYDHDPLGRRIAKHRFAPGGERVTSVWFSWDGTRLAEQSEVDEHGRTTTVTWDYEPGTDRVAGQTRRTWATDAPSDEIDSEFHAIVTDLVGTPQELVDATGAVAWRQIASVWGQAVTAPGSRTDCPLRFPGQYHDPETGWNYNFFRYYDAENARYTSPDPLGLDAAPNHHGYVRNPLGWSDPLGLISCDKAREAFQKAQDRVNDKGTAQRKAGPPPKGYHGHLPKDVEDDILRNPDAVYASTGTGDRVIVRQGDDIVVLDGKGATRGHIQTSYGPRGPLNDSGAKAYPGSLPTDPGKPITHDMIVNGGIPDGDGGFLAPAVQV